MLDQNLPVSEVKISETLSKRQKVIIVGGSVVVGFFISIIISSIFKFPFFVFLFGVIAIPAAILFGLSKTYFLYKENSYTEFTNTSILQHKEKINLKSFKVETTDYELDYAEIKHVRIEGDNSMTIFEGSEASIKIASDDFVEYREKVLSIIRSSGNLFSIHDVKAHLLTFSFALPPDTFVTQDNFGIQTLSLIKDFTDNSEETNTFILFKNSKEKIGILEFDQKQSLSRAYSLYDFNQRTLFLKGKFYLQDSSRSLARGSELYFSIFNQEHVMIAQSAAKFNRKPHEANISITIGQTEYHFSGKTGILKKMGNINESHQTSYQIQIDRNASAIQITNKNGTVPLLFGSILMLVILSTLTIKSEF